MPSKKQHQPQGPRRPHRLQPKHADAYRSDAKVADSLVCDDCNVVQHGGRWYWGAPPLGEVRGGVCPACRRIRDRFPAGTIRIPATMAVHGEDVVHLLRRTERSVKDEHPLERIMSIERADDGMTVTTTGIHIARRLTSELERHFQVKARMHYGDAEELRVELGG